MSEFMVVNPANPKRRRRKTTKRRKRSRARTRARRASNPGNPPRRRRRSGRRRNPGFMSAIRGGGTLPMIGWGVAGALGTELGGAAVTRFLPPALQANTPARLATKAALVVVGAMLAKRFIGPAAAKALLVGGGISIGVEAAREYVLPSLFAAMPGTAQAVADYLNPGMGEYLSGPPLYAAPGQFDATWGA